MHFPTTGPIQAFPLIDNAGSFVDFFFVLSGFVIAIAYRERIEQGGALDFLTRRVGRLWPLHVVTLAGTLAMAAGGAVIGLHVHGFTPSSILSNLAMTQAWGTLDRLTWNAPSWSISTEMFAYMLFALLASRLRGRALDAVCAAVMAVSFITLLTIASDFPATYDWGVLRCLVGFMAGVLVARLWQLTAFRPRGEVAATLLSLAAVAFLPQSLDFLVVPVFAWTVLVFASDAGLVSRLLHRAFAQMLGRVSYSI